MSDQNGISQRRWLWPALLVAALVIGILVAPLAQDATGLIFGPTNAISEWRSKDGAPQGTALEPPKQAMVDSAPSPTSAAPPGSIRYFSVGETRYAQPAGSARHINLRSEPDISRQDNVIATVPQGSPLTVTAEVVGADGRLWNIASAGGQQGYVSASVLARGQPAEPVLQPASIAQPRPILPAPQANRYYQTSYDCRLATTAASIAICRDAELAQRDIQLDRAYSSARSALAGNRIARADLLREQRRWIRDRENCMAEAGATANGCLIYMFDQRIAELDRIAGY